MPMLHRQYRDLTKRENPRLDWTKWARGEKDSNGVILHGWPLSCAPTALSNIRTADEMGTILGAVVRGDCHFELVVDSDDKHDFDAQTDTSGRLYEPGGIIIRFDHDHEPKDTRTTAPGRGRKRKTQGTAFSPDRASTLRPSKRLTRPARAEATAVVSRLM
ncbi:hypothetical protein BC826DRAFT_305116 [Russula brevipes]|nr:hypothetical protein BC826DRAFT_305116 [Russula brevipes]